MIKGIKARMARIDWDEAGALLVCMAIFAGCMAWGVCTLAR